MWPIHETQATSYKSETITRYRRTVMVLLEVAVCDEGRYQYLLKKSMITAGQLNSQFLLLRETVNKNGTTHI